MIYATEGLDTTALIADTPEETEIEWSEESLEKCVILKR